MKPIRFAMVIFAATALIGVAEAQSSYPCVNDVPNPYKQVTGWAHMERAWAPTNNVFIDGKDNVWVMDRCEDKGCLGSHEAPIWELSPDGKALKNFGAGMFLFPHTVKPDAEGNVWAIDGDAKEGKGNQVFKLSPDGKFIKSFGHLGSGDGELKGPHVLAFDSQGRLFVADRSNSRVAIFDQDGKFLAAWKQFGRPSGIFIDKNDMLYVSDSESEDAPGKDTNNPGCKRGIRGGSVKDGKVQFYIPPPSVRDPKFPPPEGVAADSHGNIYAAAVQAMEVYKYVRK